MFDILEHVTIAEPFTLDVNVLLGVQTGRHIADHSLWIGPNARIRSGTVIYGGSRIGAGLQTGHNVIIREENQIGDDLNIWNGSTIDYGCVLGNGVKIHCKVYIAQFSVLEDGVFLAPGVTFANDVHPLCGLCMDEQAPVLKRHARLGVNVTVLPGVTIGEYALIGAGSVVTRSIPAYAVAYGNPARVHGNVNELECAPHKVGWPYVEGEDVKARY